MQNTLYYGDNLKVLREHIPSESIDLIYLDPPFNSNRSYNVLFKDESGQSSDSQITAFDDAWHWGETAERTYQDLIQNAPLNVATMIEAMRKFIGTNQMMAYLVMMAARLSELHRVLKPSGSLYLHCDPTSSHYLKVVLDTVFGLENFINEISWKRTNAHNIRTKGFVRTNDIILFYSKSENFIFNEQFGEYSKEQLDRYQPDENGRLYTGRDLTFTGTSPSRQFEWRGVKPPSNRVWGTTKEQLEKWYSEGRILLKRDGNPRLDGLKVYLDETRGNPITTNWTDIDRIRNTSSERLGFPTQKPLALLERIIQASSNPGDIVLDPFSGCGTCIAAAQKLGRRWLGIDITHLAIAMHKARLKDMFGLIPGKDYRVIGEPEDLSGAHQLARDDRYQFQWWALSLIQARPLGEIGVKEGKKGADRGIDGMILFQGDKNELGRAVVQVKSGHVNSAHIRDLKGVLEREKAAIGIFLTLEEPTSDMETEAVSAGFHHSETWQKDYPRIQILTIAQVLDGKRPDLPPTPQNALAFKKAEKVKGESAAKQRELGI